MSKVIEGVVGVNMKSKFDETERRIKFDDQDGWYGCAGSLDGIEALEKSNKVKVRVEGTGNDAQIVKVALITKGDGGAKRGGGGYKGGGGGGGKSQMSKEEWAEKDLQIRYQSARNAAITAVALAVEVGALVLGTAKAKPEAKLAVLNGQLDLYTAQFYADVENKGAVVRTSSQLDEDETVEDDDDFDDETSGDDEFDDDIPF